MYVCTVPCVYATINIYRTSSKKKFNQTTKKIFLKKKKMAKKKIRKIYLKKCQTSFFLQKSLKLPE